MADSAFPDLDLKALQIFSLKIGRRYPAISHIALYSSARPELNYVIILEIQDTDPLEYREARNACAEAFPFHDIKGRPACIQNSEDEWLFWPIDKSINEKSPHELVIESSGHHLYTANNRRWQDIKESAQGEYEIDINEMCKNAKYNNQIDIYELAHILGGDDQYNDLLPKLFEKYQESIFKNDRPPDFKTETGKIGIWFNLLQRFGYACENSPVPLNKKIPTFKGINGNPQIIRLNELKKYFTEFLEIPLPSKLFPPMEPIREKTLKKDIIVCAANVEKYFPHLHIHILKMYAQRWVKKFQEAPIERVLLYSFSPIDVEGYMLEREITPNPLPMEYAVVFEVDADNKLYGMTPEEQLKYSMQNTSGQRPKETYERLLNATKPNRRLSDNEQYHDLMTADFVKIYKWPEKDNHPEKWEFIVKFKNSELNANIRTDEPFVVLWGQDACNLKSSTKSVRESTRTKEAVQSIAKDIWQKYPVLLIKNMEKHPQIKELAKAYSGKKTLHRWLSKVAPNEAKNKGRRSKEATEKQYEICKRLCIDSCE